MNDINFLKLIFKIYIHNLIHFNLNTNLKYHLIYKKVIVVKLKKNYIFEFLKFETKIYESLK